MSVPRQLYLFFLTNKEGHSYYVENGIVKSRLTPTWLPEDPEGWKDAQISFGRNARYFGLNRSFTNPLKFIGDGAQIIRHLFWTNKGIEQELYLLINKWNDQNGIYEPYYKAQVDLSKKKDKASTGVTVNLLESGLLQLLKANENKVYEIPCDGSIPENIKIKIDGILLKAKYNYSFINYSYLFNSIVAATTRFTSFPIAFLNIEGESAGIISGNMEAAAAISDSVWFQQNTTNLLLSSLSDINIRLSGTWPLKCSAARNGAINRVTVGYAYGLPDGTSNFIPIQVFNNVVAAQSLQTTINVSTTLNALKKLVLLVKVELISANTFIQLDSSESPLTIELDSKPPNTETWAIKPEDLFKLLVNKMTAGKYAGVSSLLQNYSHLSLTSGMALRRLEKAVIKTSLSDFFTSFNAVLNAALGNEKILTAAGEQLFFEKKEYVFDRSSVTLSLGEVADLEIEVAENYFFNDLKIGYPEQKYDEKQGQNEYNTTSQYSLPLLKLQKDNQLISKYRADSYGIEYTRNFTPGNNTVNNKSDNDVFILCIDTATPTTETFQATKNNPELDNTGNAAVKYETIGGSPLFIANADNSEFTYTGAAQNTLISGSIAVKKTDNSNCGISIRVNDVPVWQTIQAGDGNTNGLGGGTGINVVLNPGDKIKVFVSYVGVGLIPNEVLHSILTIKLTAVVVYNLLRENYTSITGIVNPQTAYNIKDLTPARMVRAHGNWIRSLLHNQVNEYLTFLTSDKNKELATVLGATTIIEKMDIAVSLLNNPLFYPYIFLFRTKVPFTFEQIMNGAANGHIHFTYNGISLYGFPFEVSVKPTLNDEQEWKLLMSPMTNLSELEDLDINGLNFINAMGLSLFVPHLCPVKFVRLGATLPAQYHFKHMDEWWFSEQIQHFVHQPKYFAKWQTNDVIKLQCQTNGLGPVQVELLNAQGTVVATVPLNNVADPSVVLPQVLFEGSVNLNGLDEGAYYLLLSAGTGGTISQMISEPLHIKADHPDTLLFEYSNKRNKQACVFTTGYKPSFRVEGWLDGFKPDSQFTTHVNQPADIELLNGIPIRGHRLNIGYNEGLPDWAIDKMNRIMLLNDVSADGLAISRDGDSKFEEINIPGSPLKFWSIRIREAKNRDGVSVAADGSSTSGLTVVYNIDTAAFGDGAGSSNIVQVTKVDD